jgi:hypothetical protein
MIEYSVYGVRVRCDWPLDLPPAREDDPSIARVDFVEGRARDFGGTSRAGRAECAAPWFVSRPAPDGTTYLRWTGFYEFNVSADGGRVACRPLGNCGPEVFQDFLFGQALSFALVRQGLEQLHAAVVNVNGVAVGFLGDCGYGKSTLAAAFLKGGYTLVTDDLLSVDRHGNELVAFAGARRIKLRPDSARALLGEDARGRPLNARTSKRLFPLEDLHVHPSQLRLAHLVVLPAPSDGDRTARTAADGRDDAIGVRPLSRRQLFHALVRNSFNVEIDDAGRLARQFVFAAQVASLVDGWRVSAPRGLHRLPAVRDAIVRRLAKAM